MLARSEQVKEVILLCRSTQFAELTAAEIKQSGGCKTSIVICDLARIGDVKAAIAEICKQHESLDALFINAGLGYAPRRIETQDGMDSHFQVNYLSQFMLTLNLLPLIEKSTHGPRIIFNATHFGEVDFENLQLSRDWTFERAIFQAMAAKRMFLRKLHALYRQESKRPSFIGYEVSKTVWSNQLEIIPRSMRLAASIVKLFGGFMSIEECGKEMAPLFLEDSQASLQKSGKLMTWKKNEFQEVKEIPSILDPLLQERLWKKSLELCGDAQTRAIAERLGRAGTPSA